MFYEMVATSIAIMKKIAFSSLYGAYRWYECTLSIVLNDPKKKKVYEPWRRIKSAETATFDFAHR